MGGAPATRYAALTRGRAAAVVVAWLVATAWFLAGARRAGPEPAGLAQPGARLGGDVELYKAIVARMRAGQGYYDAAGAELRARDYPVRPVFNWRQPTYAWLLARLPRPLMGNALLGALGLAVVLLTYRWLGARGGRTHPGLAAGLMAITMAGALVGNFIYLQEAWAGALIALSVCLFALDRWRLAVAASLAALAFREFALLPCAVGLLLALRRRRWSEASAWVAGLGAYAAFLGWHFAEVARHLGPHDLQRGWVAFGGATFLVRTASWSPLLVALPGWAVALVLPLVLLGLVGWTDAVAPRVALVVFGFLVVFAFVGNPFNDYWGAMYAPLAPFGLMAAPGSVRELARALGRR
jgi:hypothetical protein